MSTEGPSGPRDAPLPNVMAAASALSTGEAAPTHSRAYTNASPSVSCGWRTTMDVAGPACIWCNKTGRGRVAGGLSGHWQMCVLMPPKHIQPPVGLTFWRLPQSG